MHDEQTILDPEYVNVLELPRSSGRLQPDELAIVIARHLNSSDYLVALGNEVEDVYSDVGEPALEPFERPLNLSRPKLNTVFRPIRQIEGCLGMVAPAWVVHLLEQSIVAVVQCLEVNSHQMLVRLEPVHGPPVLGFAAGKPMIGPSSVGARSLP